MQTKNNLQDLYLDYPHERYMGEWKYGLFEKEKKKQTKEQITASRPSIGHQRGGNTPHPDGLSAHP